MKATPPNEHRLKLAGHWASDDTFGMNGAFSIPLEGFGHRVIANCIVSDGSAPEVQGIPGLQWEHVSVHVVEYGLQKIPTWAQMCAVKDIFWNEDEAVVQFHPAKKDHINHNPNVLHLWRPRGGVFPMPAKVCV